MQIRTYRQVGISALAAWGLAACAALGQGIGEGRPGADDPEVAPTNDTAPAPAQTSGTVSSVPGSTTGGSPAPTNPNTPVVLPAVVPITVFVEPDSLNMHPVAGTNTVAVTVPWVQGPTDGNCNIACNALDANYGLVASAEGGSLVGYISVTGTYAGMRCLPKDAGTAILRTLPTYSALCASKFKICASSGCFAHGGTGDVFGSLLDNPNRVGMAIGSNDYLGGSGCYVRCLKNPGSPVLIGFMRVPGAYHDNHCEPTAYGSGDFTNAYATQCAADFMTCANNVCYADGDLTAPLAHGPYEPDSLGGSQCMLPVFGQLNPPIVVPGSYTNESVCIPADVGENVDVSGMVLYETRCANAYPNCDNNVCWVEQD